MLYKEYVYFQVEPSEMTIVNRITEGLDHLGVLTALDGKKGIACLRTTEDTAVEARRLLSDLPVSVRLLTYEDIVKTFGIDKA